MKEELPRVNTAATLFQEYCYQYRDQFSAGILCCGYDEVDGGQVYSIPLGGMKIRCVILEFCFFLMETINKNCRAQKCEYLFEWFH